MEKKLYPQAILELTVRTIVATARSSQNGMDIRSDFIHTHPWIHRYLGVTGQETRTLREIAKCEFVLVERVAMSEETARYREQKGLPSQILFRVFVPKGTEVSKNEIFFLFEEQEDGLFAYVERQPSRPHLSLV